MFCDQPVISDEFQFPQLPPCPWYRFTVFISFFELPESFSIHVAQRLSIYSPIAAVRAAPRGFAMKFRKPQSIFQAFAVCFFQAFAVWFVVLTVPVSAFAQRTSGTILGIVADSTGAHVAGAKIVVTNVETQAAQTVKADGLGEYQLPGLPDGVYRLAASSEGFKAEVVMGIKLTIGATITVNLTLQPGVVSESVVV